MDGDNMMNRVERGERVADSRIEIFIWRWYGKLGEKRC